MSTHISIMQKRLRLHTTKQRRVGQQAVASNLWSLLELAGAQELSHVPQKHVTMNRAIKLTHDVQKRRRHCP